MLYQTPHPLFLFQFQPFPSSSSSYSHISSYRSPLSQCEREMELVEAVALKNSFRKDTGMMKLSPQTLFIEELSGFNVQNGAPPCDDLFVDQLLDFSHVDEQQQDEEEETHKEKGDSACVSPQSHHTCKPTHDFASLPTTELSLPDDGDVADLEWLSHFVEDSFSEFSPPIPTVTNNPKQPAPEKPDPILTQPCFKTPVPAKARSKRTRTGVRVWPLGSPTFTDSSSCSTTSSSSTSSSPSSPLLIYTTNLTMEHVSSEAPLPPKKPKKKPSSGDGGGAAAGQAPRRCSHCGVQKTPQWRTGPLGAKTLCNACGVRFKSGRLLPEYRPACSPTFSSELHSNHHRKVLEMRRKKEVTTDETTTGLATPPPTVVPSF